MAIDRFILLILNVTDNVFLGAFLKAFVYCASFSEKKI